VLGLAGLLPFAATSLATVFCAWDMHYADIHQFGVFLTEQQAEYWLHILERIQVAYGAVVCFRSPFTVQEQILTITFRSYLLWGPFIGA
jgi:hypothetical protein